MSKSAFLNMTKTARTKIANLSVALVFTLSGVALPTLASQTALAAGTVVVNSDTSAGENQPGWMFNRDASTSTPYEFNFDQASIGSGSLYVPPIAATPANKFIAEDFLLTPMDGVNSISYDFMIGSGGDSSDAQQFYMSVYANFGSSSATKFYDCRYNVIPSTGSTSSFTTMTFDPNASYTFTQSGTSPGTCPTSPAAMGAGASIRAIALNVGDTSASDTGLDGYLDNVVVNLDSDVTTYDFDPVPLPACTTADNGNFEGFTTGSVNGQGGWSSTGAYDQEVVDNTYGYAGNGCKSLRLSNGVTSGAFGDQTFSYSAANEAGEADSTSGGQSGGTRQSHYEAQFDIASTQAAQQPGLALSVSPDRGDGSRMSYLRFEDGVSGIDVYFDDVQGTDNPANFVETQVASGLSRSTAHTVKFVIDYVDGPSNDVVNIYIDGTLVHTGTTWENYYRYDSESSAEQSPRTTDSLIFRAAGTAVPVNSGNGFLFDNVGIATSTPTPPTPPSGGGSGSGSGGGSGSSGSGNTGGTNTATSGRGANFGFGFGLNAGEVLGITTDNQNNDQNDKDKQGKVKSASVEKKDASDTQDDFLGLGWWWLPIIIALLVLLYLLYRRIRQEQQD